MKITSDTFPSFAVIFTKGNNFCDFLFAFLRDKPFENGVFF